MNCKNCGSPVSIGALICNNCYMQTGNCVLENCAPPCDMYGNKVIAFTPDEDKNKAREKYLASSGVLNNISYNENVNLHSKKPFYYVNSNVIGYSLLVNRKEDKWGNITRYFTFHEIDRKNIRDIIYDSKYGEYVLLLYRPVYVDFSLAPTTEFRIQDIFDDTKLSIILKCSLPPKYMMY